MLAPNIVNITEIIKSFIIAVANSPFSYNLLILVRFTAIPSFAINNVGIITNVVTVTIIRAITINIIGNFLVIFPFAILYPYNSPAAINAAKIENIIPPYMYTNTHGIVAIAPPTIAPSIPVK